MKIRPYVHWEEFSLSLQNKSCIPAETLAEILAYRLGFLAGTCFLGGVC